MVSGGFVLFPLGDSDVVSIVVQLPPDFFLGTGTEMRTGAGGANPAAASTARAEALTFSAGAGRASPWRGRSRAPGRGGLGQAPGRRGPSPRRGSGPSPRQGRGRAGGGEAGPGLCSIPSPADIFMSHSFFVSQFLLRFFAFLASVPPITNI